MDSASLISTLRYGGCREDLSTAIAEMIQAMAETGKAGTITLKLDFVPVPNSKQFWIRDTISAKEPVKANADTLFFYDDEFRPSRNDPRQLELRELREANT